MEKQFAVEFCDSCDGTGKSVADYHGNIQKIAKSYGDDEFPVYVDQAHSPYTCSVCKGYAVVNKNGYNYKTAAMAKRMADQGKAKKCWHCDDDGMTWRIPALQKCRECNGSGFELVYDSESTIIPHAIDIYKYPRRSFLKAWADDVKITVARQGGELSWGESYLGLGAIWTCTDYGAAAESSDAQVIDEVRDKLRMDSVQLISLCDKETRALAREVIVKVVANGYSVIAVGKKPGGYALPPTYHGIVDMPTSVVNRAFGI